jgi:predicted PurR-regulated permease PerM
MTFSWSGAASTARDAESSRDRAGNAEQATVAPRPRIHRIEITARTMFTLLLVLGACWLLVRLSPVLLVLITSLMLVGSLSPAVEWLEARGVRRGKGIGIVFAILLGVVLLLITIAIPEVFAQATSLMEREPKLREQLAQLLSRQKLTAPMANSLRQINYAAMLGTSTQMAFSTSLRVVETVAYGVGAVFLALYMMIDRDRLRGALFALVPRTQHVLLSRVMLNLERIVGGYIRGQVITCALMAVFMFALLTAFGVKSALALAVVAGVADVLPYIGGLLVLGPALLATLGHGLAVTGIVAALILVYQEIESRLLVPWVYGRALRLPSSVVLLALLAGGTLNGIVGALLALPVAAALLMLIDELRVELPGRSETPEIEQQRERDEVSEQEYATRTEGLPVHEAAAIAVEIADERKREEEQATVAGGDGTGDGPPPPA